MLKKYLKKIYDHEADFGKVKNIIVKSVFEILEINGKLEISNKNTRKQWN